LLSKKRQDFLPFFKLGLEAISRNLRSPRRFFCRCKNIFSF